MKLEVITIHSALSMIEMLEANLTAINNVQTKANMNPEQYSQHYIDGYREATEEAIKTAKLILNNTKHVEF